MRLKPKVEEKETNKDVLQIKNDHTLKIDENYYSFDKIFDHTANQEMIFNDVGATMCRQLF